MWPPKRLAARAALGGSCSVFRLRRRHLVPGIIICSSGFVFRRIYYYFKNQQLTGIAVILVQANIPLIWFRESIRQYSGTYSDVEELMASTEDGNREGKNGEGQPSGDSNGNLRRSLDNETSPQTSAFQSAVAAWRSKPLIWLMEGRLWQDWVDRHWSLDTPKVSRHHSNWHSK